VVSHFTPPTTPHVQGLLQFHRLLGKIPADLDVMRIDSS
jgi:hypothetical protein